MTEGAVIQSSDAARGRLRSFNFRRWGTVLGGGALAVYGVTRRSPWGYAVAAGGGALAFAGSRANQGERESVARSTVLINSFPEEAYRFWRDFENLPRFMRHLDSVSKTGENRWRWVALGPMGARVSWDAEVTGERDNQFISWRSLESSDVDVEGSVEFRPAPANRGTLVRATMRFHSMRGKIGSVFAKLMGKDPSFLMRQDLRRFKALVETGEIPTTDGQSHGPRDVMTAVARIIDPDRPLRRDETMRDLVEEHRRVS